ncbi:MAG: SpoIIE family protein phosphatase [Bacteroidetes bacterium]|nr:SpoIIE family protein phosphatase [Bacteroidota bacterium]
MKRRGLIFFICLVVTLFCKKLEAQNAKQKYDKSFYLINISPDFVFDPVVKHEVDSILNLYHKTRNDTMRLYYLRLFSEGLEDPVLWTSYNKYLYDYSRTKNDSLHIFYTASALNNLGYEQQYIHNNLESAKSYYLKADTLFRTIHNYAGLGGVINNIAYIYQHEGNLQEAIELYIEAGKLFEKENQPLGLTSIYINLGDIYFQNDELDNADNFFKKALFYSIKTKQENVVANVYNQLAVVAGRKNKVKVAIDYYKKATAIYEKNKVYSRVSLMNIGLSNAYAQLKDTVQYVKYTTEAYRISHLFTDLQIKTKVYNKLVSMYLLQKDLKNAALFADSAYKFASQINYPELVSDAAYNLSQVFKQKGNYQMAFNYLAEYQRLNDSIHTNTIRNKIIKSQYQLEYNKKELELKADQDKKDAIRRAEKKQQQLILFIVSVGLFVIAVFGFIAFVNFRKTKKANVIIENQKLQVELKNEEITHQKELVDEKQKEIIDSINYAKRIQQAVLTGEDVWDKVSKEHFILFKPKDIVSGDFYWAYNTPNNRSVFALADCTGHGVPGGFMSMLGNSFLNEIVIENKLFKADEILNKLRAKIIQALEQKGGTQQKDGMDISLCVWNKIDNTLEFAGANNPLWLLRGNELHEYKADKMPIGLYLETEVPFSSVTIQLQKGDTIYLSTDGFADQFGGPKGKKFKYKPLIELLIRNSSQSMEAQKTSLEEAFTGWKHTLDQVDDVSVIGIRV